MSDQSNAEKSAAVPQHHRLAQGATDGKSIPQPELPSGKGVDKKNA
jgi:hypothetical protein